MLLSKKLSDSHLVLVVKDICVGAFTNYILIGGILNYSFDENCVKIPVAHFKTLHKELQSMLSYLIHQNQLDRDYTGECFQSCIWKGQIVEGNKLLSIYKNEFLFSSFDFDEFDQFLNCLYQILPLTFLFTDINIRFCEQVTQNEALFAQLVNEEPRLKQYINDFCTQNQDQTNFATKITLRHIFYYYSNELVLFSWLNERRGAHRIQL